MQDSVRFNAQPVQGFHKDLAMGLAAASLGGRQNELCAFGESVARSDLMEGAVPVAHDRSPFSRAPQAVEQG